MRPGAITLPETQGAARPSRSGVSNAHTTATSESLCESAHRRSHYLRDTGWVALGVLLGSAACLGVVYAVLPFTMSDAFSLSSLTVVAMLFASVRYRRSRRSRRSRRQPSVRRRPRLEV